MTKLIREDFLKTISIAGRFVPVRPSLPVLANMLLEADKGILRVSTTNLDSSGRLVLPAKSEGVWKITTPAKILTDFIGSAVDKEVSLEVDKENLLVASGEIKGIFAGISASEFPTLPEATEEGSEFEYHELQEAVNNVAFAASSDEAKPILTGIFINQEAGGTIIVATDGYRLAKKTLGKKYEFNQVVIPARTLVESLRIAGEMGEPSVRLVVAKGKNQTLLVGENFQIASRLLSGTYPQFQQIIPNDFVNSFTVDKDKLTAAIKATAVFARDLGNVVRFNLTKNALKLTASTAQVGEGAATLEVAGGGAGSKIAFNSRFILEGLSAIGTTTVEVKFSGPLSPAAICGRGGKDFLYIIMPVKSQT